MATADAPTGSGAGGIRKRSVTVAGHRTSLSLEPAFWDELKRLAAAEGLSLNALVERIDRNRPAGGTGGNLSSAARLYVLERLRAAAGLTAPAATRADP